MVSRADRRRDFPHARREGVIDRRRGQNGSSRDVIAAGGLERVIDSSPVTAVSTSAPGTSYWREAASDGVIDRQSCQYNDFQGVDYFKGISVF